MHFVHLYYLSRWCLHNPCFYYPQRELVYILFHLYNYCLHVYIYQIKFIIKHCNETSQTIAMMYDCSIITKRKLWSYLELITFLLWVSKLIVKMQGEISLLEYQSTWNVTPRVAIRNMSKMLKYRYHHHYFVLLWMYYCSHGQAGNNN